MIELIYYVFLETVVNVRKVVLGYLIQKDNLPYCLFLLFVVVIALSLLLNNFGIGNDTASLLE